eukprot:EG_transcript_4782
MPRWHPHRALLLLCAILPCDLYSVPSGPAAALYRRFVTPLPDATPCVLLTDRAGEMGCASGGEVAGPLRLITAEGDVQALAQASSPAVLLLTNGLFEQLVDRLAATGKVLGMVVHKADTRPKDGYSEAARVPNHRFFPRQDPFVLTEWNRRGTGRMLTRYPFPLWLIANATTYATLVAKAKENTEKDRRAAGGPRWVAQTLLHMNAAGRTAEQCLADRRCQPLGGGTAWATLRPVANDRIQRGIVAAMCSVSSSGLFHEAVPAADAVVSHAVAMLAAFDALLQAPTDSLQKEILFLFFPGEDYGYLGSTRFLKDISDPYNCSTDGDDKNQLACKKPYIPTNEYRKVDPQKFKFLLDVNQVGHPDSDGLYVHALRDTEATAALVSALRANGARAAPVGKRGSPPSSLLPFLLHPGVPASAGAAVLAGYSTEYVNPYYSSIYDDVTQVSPAKVVRAAEVTARTLWAVAGGSATTTIAVDEKLVADLLHCLTENFRCSLVKSLFPGGDPPKRATWYVGAFQHRYEPGTPEQRFIYRFLANRSAVAIKKDCTSPSDCSYRKDGLTCVRNVCMKTAAYLHQGFSPAMAWDYTDSKWAIKKELQDDYSTVVESDWSSNIGVRVVLEDTGELELLIFLGGLFTTAVATLLWVFGGRYFCSKFKLD